MIKGLTAYVDVDLTLIDIDDKLLPGVREALDKMKKRFQYQLICWSHGGGDYARNICKRHGIDVYFDHFLDKPHFIIDDSPQGIMTLANVIHIDGPSSWSDFWKKLFHKDVY